MQTPHTPFPHFVQLFVRKPDAALPLIKRVAPRLHAAQRAALLNQACRMARPDLLAECLAHGMRPNWDTFMYVCEPRCMQLLQSVSTCPFHRPVLLHLANQRKFHLAAQYVRGAVGSDPLPAFVPLSHLSTDHCSSGLAELARLRDGRVHIAFDRLHGAARDGIMDALPEPCFAQGMLNAWMCDDPQDRWSSKLLARGASVWGRGGNFPLQNFARLDRCLPPMAMVRRHPYTDGTHSGMQILLRYLMAGKIRTQEGERLHWIRWLMTETGAKVFPHSPEVCDIRIQRLLLQSGVKWTPAWVAPAMATLCRDPTSEGAMRILARYYPTIDDPFTRPLPECATRSLNRLRAHNARLRRVRPLLAMRRRRRRQVAAR